MLVVLPQTPAWSPVPMSSMRRSGEYELDMFFPWFA
jgi:hypothetical protein